MRPFTVSATRTINLDQVVSWAWAPGPSQARGGVNSTHPEPPNRPEALYVVMSQGDVVELDGDEGLQFVQAVERMATISYFGWDH